MGLDRVRMNRSVGEAEDGSEGAEFRPAGCGLPAKEDEVGLTEAREGGTMREPESDSFFEKASDGKKGAGALLLPASDAESFLPSCDTCAGGHIEAAGAAANGVGEGLIAGGVDAMGAERVGETAKACL